MPEHVLATLPDTHRKARDGLRKRWSHQIHESSAVWAVSSLGESVVIGWAADRLVVVEPGFPRSEYGILFEGLSSVVAEGRRIRLATPAGGRYDYEAETSADAAELVRRVQAEIPERSEPGGGAPRSERPALERVALATTDFVAGYEIVSYHGDVLGVTVRARHMLSNIGASFRTIAGGEAAGYTSLVIQTRNQARERLAADALARGANAVIGMRFTSTEIADLMSEVAAYGTGVTIRPIVSVPNDPS